MSEEICGISRENFIAFCTKLKIPAKEGGAEQEGSSALIPMELMRTQVYLVDEILEGLSRGVHKFYVLKCRQSGTTTAGLAFILYWCFKHDGMFFSFIADSQQRVMVNRSLLGGMVRSLKDHPEWRQEVLENNREVIAFANESRIVWANANSSDEGGLGRGMGLIGCWGTELGRWKDQEGVKSLMSALAKKNPVRFHCFEGTSTGPGLFKDYWSAEDATGAKSIFIGWWLHPDYDLDLEDPKELQQYRVYWEGMPRLEREEQKWTDQIKTRFGYEVTKSQIAWWRYTLKEEYGGKVGLMYQEYPPLPEYAWQYGGKGFIGPAALASAQNVSLKYERYARYFRVELGRTFQDLRIDEVEEGGWYDLVIWEPAAEGPFVRYAISMDPAHGASEDCDAAAIQVLRCYSDCVVQVAEWTNTEIPAYQLAWVLLELTGAYLSETMINIELQGGGQAVHNEIARLQQEVAQGYEPKLAKILSDSRFYLYSRQDSVRKSTSSFNWVTTGRNKPVLLETFRDFFDRGLFEVRSPALIQEASEIMRNPRNGRLETGEQDHRLMAAAIGLQTYLQILETDIGGNEAFSRKRAVETANDRQDPDNPDSPLVEKQLDTSPEAVLRRRILDFKDEKIREDHEAMELMREQIEEYSAGLPFIRHRP
jgi:hypothetical protein